MKWSKEQFKKALDEIISKVKEDLEFRKKFIENPKKIIEDFANANLPDDFRIKVIEKDTDYDMLIVLPNVHSNELNNDTLKEVVGGSDNKTDDGFHMVDYWIIA